MLDIKKPVAARKPAITPIIIQEPKDDDERTFFVECSPLGRAFMFFGTLHDCMEEATRQMKGQNDKMCMAIWEQPRNQLVARCYPRHARITPREEWYNPPCTKKAAKKKAA